MRRDDDCYRTVDTREFLDDRRVLDVTEARAAVLGGERHSHQTHMG